LPDKSVQSEGEVWPLGRQEPAGAHGSAGKGPEKGQKTAADAGDKVLTAQWDSLERIKQLVDNSNALFGFKSCPIGMSDANREKLELLIP